ncbi:MAG: hypothetical protein V4722_24405 [Bacteroidota bacterium]
MPKYLVLPIVLFFTINILRAQQVDLFEQIALQKRNERTELEKNHAPVLPDIVLKWDKKIQKGFKPHAKISTQAQLDEELVKMRKQYAPFVRDLAPALPEIPKQAELEKFFWRLIASEMSLDEKGNLYPLPGLQVDGYGVLTNHTPPRKKTKKNGASQEMSVLE